MKTVPAVGDLVTVQIASFISAQGRFEGKDAHGQARVRLGDRLVHGALIPPLAKPAPTPAEPTS